MYYSRALNEGPIHSFGFYVTCEGAEPRFVEFTDLNDTFRVWLQQDKSRRSKILVLYEDFQDEGFVDPALFGDDEPLNREFKRYLLLHRR